MNKINFQDLPDTTTPINATNLNAMQTNVENERYAKSDTIQIYCNSRTDIAMSSAWSIVKVPFTNNRNTGTAFTFNSSTNNVTCNKAGVVDVYVTFNWFANTSPKADYMISVYKNNATKVGDIAYVNNTSTDAKYQSVSGFIFGVVVAQNDTLDLRISCGAAGTIKIFEKEETSLSLRYRRE